MQIDKIFYKPKILKSAFYNICPTLYFKSNPIYLIMWGLLRTSLSNNYYWSCFTTTYTIANTPATGNAATT